MQRKHFTLSLCLNVRGISKGFLSSCFPLCKRVHKHDVWNYAIGADSSIWTTPIKLPGHSGQNVCSKSEANNNNNNNLLTQLVRVIVTGCSIFINNISVITKLSPCIYKKCRLGRDHPPSLVVPFQMWCLAIQSQYKQACLPLSVGWNRTLN